MPLVPALMYAAEYAFQGLILLSTTAPFWQ
ncbi:hypothetical protein PSP20601_04833 [Pandoraea sputorum]|uniref:Uncharacterized protein n=1 Tax=Pandoraea sputorum TaxID=93222 RepID=A0A239SSE7_9BURK|nr:Uncharacterised protein [Pandoraea sputorum]VVE53392.1 hypothetical protein PSP20601_04833 [Pandoraea sputorum]VVE78742.1 hypothetical protein PSP31121_01814 [Pandoraea sputorum]VVE83499.1 hypothetical protein PSP31120_04144 [Pandoraea sputorum]